ncbi:MAG: hypothetical protein WKF88_11590 [Ferruginibacter sp.]
MNLKFIFLLCTGLAAGEAMSQPAPSPALGKAVLNKMYTLPIKDYKYISPVQSVSPSFYTGNLAFFCRQEIKFEKATKIPLKFRLGSVQQVDYLEGKRGSRNY